MKKITSLVVVILLVLIAVQNTMAAKQKTLAQINELILDNVLEVDPEGVVAIVQVYYDTHSINKTAAAIEPKVLPYFTVNYGTKNGMIMYHKWVRTYFTQWVHKIISQNSGE